MNFRDPLAASPAASSAAAAQSSAIPDVQASRDSRRIAIDRVGVKGLRHPVRIARDGEVVTTVAQVDMSVGLAHDRKGAHMSRFVEVLNAHGAAIDAASFRELLATMARRLEADRGTLEMRFPYFVTKTAPVTGVTSLLDYDVRLAGAVDASGAVTIGLQVVVPVTSLCPCSKEISEYGAHNQRSHVTLTVDDAREGLWIDDLIAIAEREASSELYALLKRPDEKYVTERAYDNPKFVEDLARDVAAALARDARVRAYKVEIENFESIHNHSAYACIEGRGTVTA
jgi:GTP cyclohydrolase IB